MADSPDPNNADASDQTPPEAAPTGDATEASKATATEEKTPPAADMDPKKLMGTDDIEKLLAEASNNLDQAVGGAASPGNAASAQPTPFSLGDLTQEADSEPAQSIDLLGEVEMDLRIELGRTRMRLEEVLQLRSGSVVALDKLAGDPVDIFVNGQLIARGEVLVMNDNFCIRVTELVGA